MGLDVRIGYASKKSGLEDKLTCNFKLEGHVVNNNLQKFMNNGDGGIPLQE